jgi:hypothetical protein
MPVMMRAVLEAELSRRRARNPRYSLGAFAHSLGLDHSTLSQNLRGERKLTLRMAERLEARLRSRVISVLSPHWSASRISGRIRAGVRTGSASAWIE